MKKFWVFGLAMLVTAVFGMSGTILAGEGKAASFKKSMSMVGDVVDTQCATANKDNMAGFVKTHTKECALAPACKKSGYNLYSDGKLYKFDNASNKKVAAFLEKADSKLHVKAEVIHGKGDVLKLVSIANAE